MNADRFSVSLALATTCAGIGALLLLLIGLAGMDHPPAYASPGVRYVAPGGDCGGETPCYDAPQDAVDDALPGDEIRIAASLYPIAAGAPQVVYIDKTLTMRGGYTPGNWQTPDPDTNATELTAMGQGRVMVISGTVEVLVEGLRLTFGDSEGLGDGLVGGESGAGLYVFGATVTLRHDRLLNNTAPAGMYLGGGGVYAAQSTLTVEECTIEDNYGSWGGGLLLDGSVATVRDSQISNNEAGGLGSAGGGIAILGGSDVALYDNTVSGNDATFTSGAHGGGVYVQGSHATLAGNTIDGNYSRREAGGVGIVGGAVAVLRDNQITNSDGGGNGGGLTIGWPSSAAAVTLTHNVIGHNDAVWGGGLYVENTNTLLEDNVIEHNVSYEGGGAHLNGDKPIALVANLVQSNVSGGSLGGGNGGGLYVVTGEALLARNTIQRNSALRRYGNGGSGAGLFIGADCTLANNIVTDNTGESSGMGIAVFGAEPILYHTTIANNTGGDGSGVYVSKSGLTDEPGRPTLRHTILASQTVGVNVSDSAPGNLAALYGVLWWGNTENYTGTVFVFDGVEGAPAFVSPSGYDYHIGSASAAVDAVVAESGIDDDVDGQTRPHYAASDLGADEWWPLVAIKTARPGTAQTSDRVTYTLTLSNTTDAGMAVELSDPLPGDVAFLGPLSYNNGTAYYAAGKVTWAGTVPTDTPTVITWPVEVVAEPPATITNVARVTETYGAFDTDPALVLLPPHYYPVYLPLVLRQAP